MTAEQWRAALASLGVADALADVWAPVFADSLPRMGQRTRAHFLSQVLH